MNHTSFSQEFQSAASIRERLFALSDPAYREFQAHLIPTLNPERIIGVRMPALRSIAKNLRFSDVAAVFLDSLPHHYQEENLLHALLLGYELSPERCLSRLTDYLPQVDNWAVCDVIALPCLKKDLAALLSYIPTWLQSDHNYTVRFGIKMLMDHFLEQNFQLTYPNMVALIRSEDYYVNMMIAWYFATALAKQWDSILPFLQEHMLSDWVHNKTIQKAVESYRIPAERKAILKTLRWKP